MSNPGLIKKPRPCLNNKYYVLPPLASGPGPVWVGGRCKGGGVEGWGGVALTGDSGGRR